MDFTVCQSETIVRIAFFERPNDYPLNPYCRVALTRSEAEELVRLLGQFSAAPNLAHIPEKS